MEKQLGSKITVDFMGPVTHFLGHKFQWERYTINNETHLRAHVSQTAFTDNLINLANLNSAAKPVTTPYRSGFPVDAIIPKIPSPQHKKSLQLQFRQLVGSLLWLSQGTRPDLSTITAMLSKYQNNPSPAHIEAARYAIRYVKQTKHLGITFDSNQKYNLHSYTYFPTAPKDPLVALPDANWGSQDLSSTPENHQLPLFKSRSMSGHIIFLYGPLHWQSKR